MAALEVPPGFPQDPGHEGEVSAYLLQQNDYIQNKIARLPLTLEPQITVELPIHDDDAETHELFNFLLVQLSDSGKERGRSRESFLINHNAICNLNSDGLYEPAYYTFTIHTRTDGQLGGISYCIEKKQIKSTRSLRSIKGQSRGDELLPMQNYIYIPGISVSEHYAGRKLGTLLLGYVILQTHKLKYKFIELEDMSDNVLSRYSNIYSNLGFVPLGNSEEVLNSGVSKLTYPEKQLQLLDVSITLRTFANAFGVLGGTKKHKIRKTRRKSKKTRKR